MSCHVFLSLFVVSCRALSCRVMFSSLFLSRLVFSPFLSSPLLSSLLLFSPRLRQNCRTNPASLTPPTQDPQDGLLDGAEYLNILKRRRKTTEQVFNISVTLASQTELSEFVCKYITFSKLVDLPPPPPPPSYPPSLPLLPPSMKASDVETDLLMTSLRLALKVLSLSGIFG